MPSHTKTRRPPTAWTTLPSGQKQFSRPPTRDGISPDLIAFRLKALWNAFRTESIPFWLLCGYVTIEYLRPQSMYPVLDVLPWGQVSLLLLLVSIVLTGSRPKSWNIMDVLFLGFTLMVLISGIYAWNPSVSWEAKNTYLSWILLYLGIRSVLTSPRRMLLFWVLLALINFKMSRHGTAVFAGRGFSFSGYGISGAPGWFHNSGELAMQMAVAFALTWTLIQAHGQFMSQARKRVLLTLFPLTAFITIIGSSSRGGQLALLAMCVALVVQSGRRAFRALAVFGFLVGVGWAILPAEQKARFTAMGDDDTSQSRLELWADARRIAAEHPLTGIGYRNWVPFHTQWAPGNSPTYRPDRPALVIHNTTLEAFVDLGFPGGLLFLAMLVVAFLLNRSTMRRWPVRHPNSATMHGMAAGLNLSLLGLIIAAQFMSVLFYPVFWMTFALTASLHGLLRPGSALRGPHKTRTATRAITTAAP